MKKLIHLIKEARFVFVCGNGGSAATAEHFTTDLFKKEIRAICLNSNTSLITMIANDFGYHEIFSQQVEMFGDSRDLLITISCSGTSPNIQYARERADALGMKVYTFETFSRDRDYGKLENKHLTFAHKVVKNL